MYITTTGTVIAELTQYGKKIMDENSAAFNITQYAFSDDEIDYSLFDGSSTEALNPGLSYFPIMEACRVTNKGSGAADVSWPAQRYRLVTAAQGIQQITRVIASAHGTPWYPDGKQDEFPQFDRVKIWLEYEQAKASGEVLFPIRTLYGYDSSYLIAISDSNIIAPTDWEPPSYPCPDPYAARQNQSETNGSWNIRLQYSTQGMWPRSKTNADWFHIIKYYIAGRTHSKPNIPSITIPDMTDAEVQDMVQKVTSYIDKLINGTVGEYEPVPNIFETVGVATATYMMTGRDTGKSFWFDFDIYYPWRLAVYVDGVIRGIIQ